MLFSSLAKYYDIVQFKQHHFELVQPKRDGERRLLPILLFDLSLPISTCRV
ncbi:hypothetical protein T06_9870 [Trichinella sp. T6]|nr:hypothetical protein T06_9870 [Trichinella sp. T6]